MIAEHGISSAADMRMQLLQSGQRCIVWTEGAGAIVAGKDAQVVVERTNALDKSPMNSGFMPKCRSESCSKVKPSKACGKLAINAS